MYDKMRELQCFNGQKKWGFGSNEFSWIREKKEEEKKPNKFIHISIWSNLNKKIWEQESTWERGIC